MCGSLCVDSTLNSGGQQAMICSSSEFAGWSDFPKGLRVLLIDHDHMSAAEIRLKLEKMDYIVSVFSTENDALEAIASRVDSFHVAIVEVDADNSQESFRFLETAEGFPTLMISNGNCLSTMMKCIALGAAEILQKPLSEDKLKNIWQHVVHKAFNAGESALLCKSLKLIRETMFTTIRMQTETANSENPNQRNEEDTVKEHMNQSVQDGLSAPSTPQLEQGIWSSNGRDSQNQCSAEQECEMTCNDTPDAVFMFSCSESKSADNAYNELINEYDSHEEEISAVPEEIAVRAMDSSTCSSKEGIRFEPKKSISSDSKNKRNGVVQVTKGSMLNYNSNNHSSKNKKKMKVDWTPELHRCFVQAVEQLGIDQAIPSKILALMKAEGLTRHNIASHLQKYRMHRKHALPKDEDRRWLHRRDPFSRVYAHKPLVAAPPSHSNLGYPPIYPAWGHHNFHPSGYQMWGQVGFYPRHSAQGSWPWKTYSRMYADAWGCPIFPQQNNHPTPHVPYIFSRNHGINELQYHSRGIGNPHEPLPGEQVIDEAVKEAMSKPWLPLPIGLKPPSTDSVLAELQRQGIRSIPPLA